MLVDYTGVKNIFLVCGKSDLRKGIDGLAAMITEQYDLDLFDDAIFLFVEIEKIDLRPCSIGTKMEFYSFINALKVVLVNGHAMKMKLNV